MTTENTDETSTAAAANTDAVAAGAAATSETTTANADQAGADGADAASTPVDPKTIVPETADGYALPVPEGEDGAFAKTAASWFHEAGVPPVQAEKLAAKWNEFAATQKAAQAEAEAAAEAQAQAKFESETAALKQEWGAKYDANIELGRRAFSQFGFTQDIADAVEAKVGPAQLFKIFAKIGEGLGEDSALGIGSPGATGGQSVEHTLYPNMK